jgi:DNA-binding NtrC family response regulator
MNTPALLTGSKPPGDLPPAPPMVSRPGLQTIRPAGGDQPPAAPKRSLHVLCIDDDEQILEIMKACLAQYNHRVRVASGGKRGIEVFGTAILKSEPFDVVITDLNMPDVNGYAVASSIKNESPHTPVILMTGAHTTTHEASSMSSAVNAAIGKPPRMQELNELLLRVTEDHTNPSDALSVSRMAHAEEQIACRLP